MAKRRQMPTGGLSGPTPAGMAAASMLMNSGDATYAGMMDAAGGAAGGVVSPSMDASKLEQLPAMVGNEFCS